MKYFALALLLATVSAYDQSEGPTKADNGDSDYSVVSREADIANGKKFSGWTNPLGWSDEGEADDTVVTQLDSLISLNKHHRAEEIVSENDQEKVYKYGDYMNIQRKHKAHHKKEHKHAKHPQVIAQKAKTGKDAYDHDENTVSEYDEAEQRRTFDWGVPEGEHGAYKEPVW